MLDFNGDGQLTTRWVRQTATSTDIIAPYRYTYDGLGRVLLEGHDVDGVTGLSETSGSDRVKKSVSDFWYDNGYWWRRTKQYAYPTSSGAVVVGETRSRLFADAGDLSRTIVEDKYTNETETIVEVDRSKAIVASVTSYNPYPTGDAVVVSKLGLVVHKQEPSGVNVDYEYDHLWRNSRVKTRDSVELNYVYKSGSTKTLRVKGRKPCAHFLHLRERPPIQN